MARRHGPPLYGSRYCGGTHTMEVHDLDNEDTGENGCQIDEIIAAGHVKAFNPDMLQQANYEGFKSCAKCLGESKW